MKKKIYASIGILISSLMLIMPSISAINTANSSNEVYEFGRLILVSPDIEGVEDGLYFGGMHDINITIHGGNTVLLRTRPIWGSTMVADYVDMNIQMKNFFGIADIVIKDNVSHGIFIGICQDISWEKL